MDSLSSPAEAEQVDPSTRVDFAHPGTAATDKIPAPVAPPVAQAKAAEPAIPVPALAPTLQVAKLKKKRRLPLAIGVAILVAAILAGGIYMIIARRNADTAEESTTPPPASVGIAQASPTNLSQLVAGNATPINVGGAVNKDTLVFNFNKPAGAGNTTWTPEVEVKPLSVAFSGEASSSTDAVMNNSTASVTISGMSEAAYHWQARFKQDTETSPWVSYGENEETVVDFSIDLAAPKAPVVTTIDGKKYVAKLVTLNNKPVIAGTAEPSAKITIQIKPGESSISATADASGNWTATPSTEIPNGSITLATTATDAAGNSSSITSEALTIKSASTQATPPPTPSAVAPAAPPPAPVPTPAPAPVATTPSVPSELAKTGEQTQLNTVLGLVTMLVAFAGMSLIRKRGKV